MNHKKSDLPIQAGQSVILHKQLHKIWTLAPPTYKNQEKVLKFNTKFKILLLFESQVLGNCMRKVDIWPGVLSCKILRQWYGSIKVECNFWWSNPSVGCAYWTMKTILCCWQVLEVIWSICSEIIICKCDAVKQNEFVSRLNSILIFLIDCIHHLQSYFLQQTPLKFVNWFKNIKVVEGLQK